MPMTWLGAGSAALLPRAQAQSGSHLDSRQCFMMHDFNLHSMVSMVFFQISNLTCPLLLPEAAGVFSLWCLPCASWALINRSHPPLAPHSASTPSPQHLWQTSIGGAEFCSS